MGPLLWWESTESRLKELAPQMHALRCIIHQSVLCAGPSGELKDVIDKMMRVINFVRGTSSTQHHLFRHLVAESEEATHDDLLLHNDVRWLSKGKVLERLCVLHDEVQAFLKTGKMKAAAEHHSVRGPKVHVKYVSLYGRHIWSPKPAYPAPAGER